MSAQNAPTAPAPTEWWGLTCPRPNELFAFAALNCPGDIYLQDLETLDRVVEAYIEHSRTFGYWAHLNSRVPFHETGLSGYRDRVKDYRAALTWHLRHSAPNAASAVA